MEISFKIQSNKMVFLLSFIAILGNQRGDLTLTTFGGLHLVPRLQTLKSHQTSTDYSLSYTKRLNQLPIRSGRNLDSAISRTLASSGNPANKNSEGWKREQIFPEQGRPNPTTFASITNLLLGKPPAPRRLDVSLGTISPLLPIAILCGIEGE